MFVNLMTDDGRTGSNTATDATGIVRLAILSKYYPQKTPAEFAVKRKAIKTVALAEKPMFKMLLLKQVLADAIPNAKADYKSDR